MKWPVLVGAMLIAAGPAAASSPLVYKAPPPARLFSANRYICVVLQEKMICFHVSLNGSKGRLP